MEYMYRVQVKVVDWDLGWIDVLVARMNVNTCCPVTRVYTCVPSY